ncbi:MAG: hypothetical protein AAFX85_21085, partial [Pseudomonadota bacterium]
MHENGTVTTRWAVDRVVSGIRGRSSGHGGIGNARRCARRTRGSSFRVPAAVLQVFDERLFLGVFGALFGAWQTHVS